MSTTFDATKHAQRWARHRAEGHGPRAIVGWTKEELAEWGLPAMSLVEALTLQAWQRQNLPINRKADPLEPPYRFDVRAAILCGLKLLGIDPLQDATSVHRSIRVTMTSPRRHREAYPEDLLFSALGRLVRVLDPVRVSATLQLSFVSNADFLSIEFCSQFKRRFASVLYQHDDSGACGQVRVDFIPGAAEQETMERVDGIAVTPLEVSVEGVPRFFVREKECGALEVFQLFGPPQGAAVPRPPEQANQGGSDTHQGGDGLQVHEADADAPSSPGNRNTAV